MAKYFIELGYNVDVVLTSNLMNQNPFSDYHDKRIRFFSFDKVTTEIYKLIRGYNAVVVTTAVAAGGGVICC